MQDFKDLIMIANGFGWGNSVSILNRGGYLG